jgi:hypothetical protein
MNQREACQAITKSEDKKGMMQVILGDSQEYPDTLEGEVNQ